MDTFNEKSERQVIINPIHVLIGTNDGGKEEEFYSHPFRRSFEQRLIP